MDVLSVDTLAEVLQEPKRSLLMKVLRTLGVDRTTAILADTLTCEANGGMLTKDGTRRRTPGGVFFQLVRERATKQERWRLFPRLAPQQCQGSTPPQPHAQPPPLPWDELLAIVTTLPQGAAAVKLPLLGRPDLKAIQKQPT